jgi:hypothetical protein
MNIMFLFNLSIYLFILVVLGFELRLHTCYTGILPLEPFCQHFFCAGIFKIGSQELFAQAGFKP